MATAGVAVGAIMAISPVFAQGTSPSSPTSGSTLLASILAAAASAGITLTAEQTKAIAEAIADVGVAEAATANDNDDEELEEEDDNTATGVGAEQPTKHAAAALKVTAPKASDKNEESKTED
jgi:hypothetical protein